MIFKKFSLTVLFCALLNVIYSQTTTKINRVLFVGNSYTGSNDLPNLTRNLAMSYGDTFEVFDRAPGGFTFANHCSSPDFFDQIRNGNFDAIILQEQSQLPSFPQSQVESQCFPYAKQIVDSIRAVNPKTRIVFYSTWGRQNGDAQNCASWPPVCSFQGMNELLRQRYIQMAKDNSCRVAPVTSVWRDLRDTTPLSLYEPDGSHPSAVGSLVIAGVIYSTLFDKPLSTGKFATFVTQSENQQIVNTTNSIIKDSAALWNYEYQLSVNHPSIQQGKKSNTALVVTDLQNKISLESWKNKGFTGFILINSFGQEFFNTTLSPFQNSSDLPVSQLKSGLYYAIPVRNKTQISSDKLYIWVQH